MLPQWCMWQLPEAPRRAEWPPAGVTEGQEGTFIEQLQDSNFSMLSPLCLTTWGKCHSVDYSTGEEPRLRNLPGPPKWWVDTRTQVCLSPESNPAHRESCDEAAPVNRLKDEYPFTKAGGGGMGGGGQVMEVWQTQVLAGELEAVATGAKEARKRTHQAGEGCSQGHLLSPLRAWGRLGLTMSVHNPWVKSSTDLLTIHSSKFSQLCWHHS